MNHLASAVFVLLFSWGFQAQLRAEASHLDQDEGVIVTVLNGSRIYHPCAFEPKRRYKKIGLVDSRAIFDEMPEYKEIRRRSLTRESAEYQILVARASDRFKNVVMKTVSLGGYDLVAESGAITVQGRVLPDITLELVGNLN